MKRVLCAAALLCCIAALGTLLYLRSDGAEAAPAPAPTPTMESAVMAGVDEPTPTPAPKPVVCGEYGAYSEGFDAAFEEFLSKYGYGPWNYAMAYENTVTGERILYNADAYMWHASTYKLPLNMYLNDCLAEGVYSPEDMAGGYTLERAEYLSLVYSDNEASECLNWFLGEGDGMEGRRRFSRYLDDENVATDWEFLAGQCLKARQLLAALRHLYNESERYEQVIEYMKEASPGVYFRGVITDCEVAHKYGMLEDEQVANDVGIIYSDEPFLLVVLSMNGAPMPTERTAEFMYEYNKNGI